MRVNVYLRHYVTRHGEKRHYLVVREAGRRDHHVQLGSIPKREAEQRRIVVLNELLNGTYQQLPTVRPFFGEFCDRVLSEYVAGTWSPRTLALYRECLSPVRRRFQTWRLEQIRQQDLEILLSEMPVANRTKNIRLSVLRTIFRKGVEWGYLRSSPTEKIRLWKEESKGSRALTEEELGRILDQATPWESNVIRSMVFSGMRPAELSQFKFADINWEDHLILIVSDRIRKTKTRKSRVVPMTSDVEDQLRFLQENWPNLQYGGGQGGSLPYLPRTKEQKEYVFCHRDGRPIRSFHQSIENALHRVGVQGVTPHGLRKTFCTLLARRGVHPKVAQRLMGHQDVRLTMDIYTEVGDDQIRDAVNSLPTVRDLKRGKFRVVGGTH